MSPFLFLFQAKADFEDVTATSNKGAGALSHRWRSSQGGESSKNASRVRERHFSCVLRADRGAIDVKARPLFVRCRPVLAVTSQSAAPAPPAVRPAWAAWTAPGPRPAARRLRSEERRVGKG